MIRKYFDKYTRYDSSKWQWMPYIYARDCSLDEQSKWNDLYRRTRMRKSSDSSNNDIIPPDFYSQERDAEQFNMTEYTVTDTFGLKWVGRKGCEVEVGAPDYEGHLYYYDEVEDEYPEISDYDDDKNQPDSETYYKFRIGYPHFRNEWIDIKNIQDLEYHYIVENHLFKDTYIEYTYDDGTKDRFYDNNNYHDVVDALRKFKKDDLLKKLFASMNEHFMALKNSGREEEREYYPDKTAEQYFEG